LLADSRDRAERRRLRDAARERFLRGGEPDGVAPPIARSWVRARDVYRIDPKLGRAPVLAPEELARRLASDETLEAAEPVLAGLSAGLRDRRHALAFFAADGRMLAIGGDPAVAVEAAAASFRPGADWREDAVGTNGPGTALAERLAVEVFASEHYAEGWHAWTCAAAPLLAPGAAAPAGVVSLIGHWDAADPPGVVAASAIACAVQERLDAVRSVRDEVVRHALRAARASGDPLLAVDARGRLVAANDAARRRLPPGGELPPEVVERLAAALRSASPPADELAVDWPADDRRRAVCCPVTHAGRVVGALVRVLPGPAPSPGAGGRGARSARPRSAVARYAFSDIIGDSPGIRAAVDLAQVAARNDLPVVLHGESGTGKELFAHGIHAESARGDAPFVIVNCGAIPAPLVEAELFGYEAGSFTGAQREGRAGKLEEAHGGTLFLDEVSDLAPQAQTALLRALQESEVVRVGASAPRHVDVRIVAATNRLLWDEVASGRFRDDLFFRLNVLSIDVPALRDRAGDIPVLAAAFLAEAEAKIGRTGLSLSEDAMAALARHPWPGNVRELRNVILRAAATALDGRIDAGDLRLVRPLAPAPAPAPADGSLRGARELAAAEPPEPERDELVAALDRCGWNIARTATSLGVSRMTLYRRLRRFGITR
jgi:transcriptional regulator of acetoin/glycerol metabolism